MSEVDPIVEETVTGVLDARGLELYDLELTGTGRGRVLRVLVAAPGGVDLEAIAAATDAVSPVLDRTEVAARLPEPYALEVSSPGLERPLRRVAHFRGAVGETVSIKVEGASRVRGTLVSADDDGFTVTVDGDPDATGAEQRFGYGDVTQARTVFEWGGGGMPGRGKATKEVVRR